MSLRRLGRWIHHTITSSDKRPYIDASLEELEALAKKSAAKTETFRLLGIFDELIYRITFPDRRDKLKKRIAQQIKELEGIRLSESASRREIEEIRNELLTKYAERAEAEANAKREEEEKVRKEEAERKKREAVAEEARLAAEANAKREEEEKVRKEEAERKKREAVAEEARLAAEANAKREGETARKEGGDRLKGENLAKGEDKKHRKGADATANQQDQPTATAETEDNPGRANKEKTEEQRAMGKEEINKSAGVRSNKKSRQSPELAAELKPATYNSLRRNGIKELRDLDKKTCADLLQMKNIGPVKAAELIEFLRHNNILNPDLAIGGETLETWKGTDLEAEYLEKKLIAEDALRKYEKRIITSEGTQETAYEGVQIGRQITDALDTLSLTDEAKTTVMEFAQNIQCNKSLTREAKLSALEELIGEIKDDSPRLKAMLWIADKDDTRTAEDITGLCSYRELRYSNLYRAIASSESSEAFAMRRDALTRVYIRSAAQRMINCSQEGWPEKKGVERLLEILEAGSGDILIERCEKIEEDWIRGKRLNILLSLVAGKSLSQIGEREGLSRERVRQIKAKTKTRYKIEIPDGKAEKKTEEKIRTSEVYLDRFSQIIEEAVSTEYSTSGSTLNERVGAYRYFNCPIPSMEYKRHLQVIKSSQNKNRIGIGYWDDDSNLRGLLWAIIEERGEGYVMPKQVSLPTAIRAAIQKFGGQGEVAKRIRVEYQGQVVGTESRSFWTNAVIQETVHKVQLKYCLPHDVMPEQTHISEFVDSDGDRMTKGSSCIAAIKRQHGTWDGYARHAKMKIYNRSDNTMRYQIDKEILKNFWLRSGGYSSEKDLLESFNDFMSGFWKSSSDPSRYTSLISLSRRLGEALRIMTQEETRTLRICQFIDMLGEGEALVSQEEDDIDRFLDLLF
jgi:hypothetical protein